MKIFRIADRFFDVLIIAYFFIILCFFAFGEINISWPFKAYMEDIGRPLAIIAGLVALKYLASFAEYVFSKRRRTFVALTVLISFTLTAGAGEAFLRVYYSDAGTKTAGAPGGKNLQCTLGPSGTRFPTISGPKKPGVTRILILGDSITDGLEPEWTDLYPYLLHKKLNSAGDKYEVGVSARSGREISHHVESIRYEIIGKKLDPDIVIYQWYMNDLELNKQGRPHKKGGGWRKLPWHRYLEKNSYLYYFLDYQMSAHLLPWKDRSYIEYLREDYAEDTINWAMFRIELHNWAALATSSGRKALVFLYPALPFKGEYPLHNLNQAMANALEESVLSIPAVTMPHIVGKDIEDKSAKYGKARQSTGTQGVLMYGPYITLQKGEYEAGFRLRLDEETNQDVAVIDIVSSKGENIIYSRRLGRKDFDKPGEWTRISAPFDISEEFMMDVEFRVVYLGGAGLSVDRVDLPTKYGIETLDLTDHLKDMNTAVSIFNGHPNKATYKVMADLLYDWVTKNGVNRNTRK